MKPTRTSKAPSPSKFSAGLVNSVNSQLSRGAERGQPRPYMSGRFSHSDPRGKSVNAVNIEPLEQGDSTLPAAGNSVAHGKGPNGQRLAPSLSNGSQGGPAVHESQMAPGNAAAEALRFQTFCLVLENSCAQSRLHLYVPTGAVRPPRSKLNSGGSANSDIMCRSSSEPSTTRRSPPS